MPSFYATYDLTNTNPSPYAAFIDAAVKKGWGTWVLINGNQWFKLPNTTLYGEFADLASAERALIAAKAGAEQTLGRGVTLEKYVVIQNGGALIISDVRRPRA